MKRYLLIISCSDKKAKTPGAIPACERYTGPPCWVLRRAKKEKYLPNSLDVLIVSAKYGLLEWNEKIEDYNQKMDDKRADELRSIIQEKLEVFLNGKYYDQLFNGLWDVYNKTLEDFDFTKYIRDEVEVEKNRGKKMAQMKAGIKELFQKELQA